MPHQLPPPRLGAAAPVRGGGFLGLIGKRILPDDAYSSSNRILEYACVFFRTMRLPPALACTRSTVERLPSTSVISAVEQFYLLHGCRANAHSVAFDPDLERFVSPLGVLAHAHCRWLCTTIVYYDPICSDCDLPALIDEFLAACGTRHSVGFWKVSRETADILSARGGVPFTAAPPMIGS